MNYEVKRMGKCIECGQDTTTYLGEFEGITEQEAINKAIKNWIYEQFGEAGALKDNDIMKEERFLNAMFSSKQMK
jgi:hypothetical protein